jgi:hypothetical protein
MGANPTTSIWHVNEKAGKRRRKNKGEAVGCLAANYVIRITKSTQTLVSI